MGYRECSGRSTALTIVKLAIVDAEIPAHPLGSGTPFVLAGEYEGWIEKPSRWLTHSASLVQLRVHERPGERILGAIDEVGYLAFPAWLGDWVAGDEGLVHVTSGARVPLSRPPASSLARVLAASQEPLRALYGWQGDSERHVELLGEGGSMGSFSFPSPDAVTFVSAADVTGTTVLPEQAFSGKERVTSGFWIDMARGAFARSCRRGRSTSCPTGGSSWQRRTSVRSVRCTPSRCPLRER